MRAAAAVLLLAAPLAACDRLFGVEPGVRPDGGASGVDADAGMRCLGAAAPLLGDLCVPVPTQPRVVPLDLDTDDDGLCDLVFPHQPVDLCVLVGTSIEIALPVAPRGSRPLVLVAMDDLSIGSDGAIDVSARADGQPAAGSSGAACAMPGAGASGPVTGAGGAGGAYSRQGGSGGDSAKGTLAGGASAPAISLGSVRGGCAGGSGGVATGAAPPAVMAHGGWPGGAVHLVAGQRIRVAGFIDASGGGGQGGLGAGGSGGGGGGGSGGFVALAAPSLELAATARILANGGGGGGGGGYSPMGGAISNGGPGASPDPLGGAEPFLALGGVPGIGDGPGGVGGAGEAGAAMPMPGVEGSSASGGGGGGGGGYVRGYTAVEPVLTTGAFISPAPQWMTTP